MELGYPLYMDSHMTNFNSNYIKDQKQFRDNPSIQAHRTKEKISNYRCYRNGRPYVSFKKSDETY